MEFTPIFPSYICKSKFHLHQKYNNLFDESVVYQSNSPDPWTGRVFTSFHEKNNSVNTDNLEKDLVEFIHREINIPNAYVSEIWYNIYHEGYFQERHHHCTPGVILSGIYFHKNSTSPIFWNRDASIISSIGYHKYLFGTDHFNIRMGDNIKIKVSDGDVIFFPPDLEHEVSIYKNDCPRITFSFNISVGKKWIDK